MCIALIFCFTHVFTALHTGLCYSPAMMDGKHVPLRFVLCCCMLAACAPQARKADVMDLYELPQKGVGAKSLPIDNDSYYSQPAVYKGCTTINDAPSCGGG